MRSRKSRRTRISGSASGLGATPSRYVAPELWKNTALTPKDIDVVQFYDAFTPQIPLGFDPELFHIQTADQIARTRARLGLTKPAVAY